MGSPGFRTIGSGQRHHIAAGGAHEDVAGAAADAAADETRIFAIKEVDGPQQTFLDPANPRAPDAFA